MLLREIGFHFSVLPSHADESFSDDINVTLVPALLARRKAEAVFVDNQDSIVLASDTVVIVDNNILNKPVDRADAIRMLKILSGITHTVITAVHLKGPGFSDRFEDVSRVTFRKVSDDAVANYVDVFRPFDKAGSYGAQECLPSGFNPCSDEEVRFLSSIGKSSLIEKSMNRTAENSVPMINKIDGSFFTVMGLPIHLVYRSLSRFHA